MNFHDVDGVFSKILNSSKLKENRKLNERGNGSNVFEQSIEGRYNLCCDMGKLSSNSEVLFDQIPSPHHYQQQGKHQQQQQPQQQKKNEVQGMPSHVINERQSQRRCLNKPSSSSACNPPFATGSSYNECDPKSSSSGSMKKNEQPYTYSSFTGQPQSSSDIGINSWELDQPPSSVRGSYEQDRRSQGRPTNQSVPPPPPPPVPIQPQFQPRASYDFYDRESVQPSPFYEEYHPQQQRQTPPPPPPPPLPTQTRPAAGMRQDDMVHRGGSQRSDPTRPNSLGSMPSTTVTRCFPIHHGTGEYAEDHPFFNMEGGNAPAIVQRLRDITAEHRDKLDLIFPEVVRDMK
jgi:hypothetical protein